MICNYSPEEVKKSSKSFPLIFLGKLDKDEFVIDEFVEASDELSGRKAAKGSKKAVNFAPRLHSVVT